MPTKDKDDAAEQPKAAPAEQNTVALKAEGSRVSARVRGASFVAGQWLAEDGTPLTDKEAQQAHRLMDARAAAERERIMEGR